MKVADSVMAGKASDSSIKWQLCYDMSARTWWMVSWCDNFFFLSLDVFFSFLNSSFTVAMHMLQSSERAVSSSSSVTLQSSNISEIDRVSLLLKAHGPSH